MSDKAEDTRAVYASPSYPALFEGLLPAGCATVLTSEGPVEIDADRFSVYPEVVAFFVEGETTGVFERGHSAFQGFINGELEDEDDGGYFDPDDSYPAGPEDEEDYVCDDCLASEGFQAVGEMSVDTEQEGGEWFVELRKYYNNPVPYALAERLDGDWRNPKAYP